MFVQSLRMSQTHPVLGRGEVGKQGAGFVPSASHQPRPGRQWTWYTVKLCLCMSTGGLERGVEQAAAVLPQPLVYPTLPHTRLSR